ncbi:MAG: hypothetical protein RML40_10110, partial [Bacteroidota bacterium]|nr:hypothetical protein [Candidatus Kapabacteria bacterium]MDW8220873.1 hypothetical protein [Bacteroidota bacterium]
ERVRSVSDKRLSIARITHKGLALLDETSLRCNAIWDDVECRISRAESMMLAEICAKLSSGYSKTIRVDV